MEGHWENRGNEAVPLIVFGWPDMQREQTRFAVEIPHLGSLILTHSWTRQFKGLKDFAPEDRPNSTIIFWTFRAMVGLGTLMILLGLWSLLLRRRERLHRTRPFLRATLLMGPMGLVALLAGWLTTEIGRQPWVVYGLQRTAEATSPSGMPQVALSATLFVVSYFFVFGVGIAYILRLVRKGPSQYLEEGLPSGGPGQERTPARPLSAVGDESPGTTLRANSRSWR
jgi:cytochrome d ubiquinol oxidase subunit I